MKDKAYKYRYEYTQVGNRVELFGTDIKATDELLNDYRKMMNTRFAETTKEGNIPFINRLWLVDQKTGKVIARSSAAMFEVV